jgi:hypothetical protein
MLRALSHFQRDKPNDTDANAVRSKIVAVLATSKDHRVPGTLIDVAEKDPMVSHEAVVGVRRILKSDIAHVPDGLLLRLTKWRRLVKTFCGEEWDGGPLFYSSSSIDCRDVSEDASVELCRRKSGDRKPGNTNHF